MSLLVVENTSSLKVMILNNKLFASTEIVNC